MKKILFLFFIFSITFGLMSCTGDEKITITFESNGGSEVEDMEVGTDQASLNLPTPTRDGYTFDGWYLDVDLTEPFTIGALLTNDTLTLYAKWNEIILQVTITFNSNGGTAISPITQATGTQVTAPTAPTKEGFTFGGWYSDAALTTAYTFTTMPAENITLYAKWHAVIVQTTMTFETNGGNTIAPLTADVGSSVTLPSPTKVGHTFAGWYSDIALTTAYTMTIMPATNQTLYAKWTVNPYTITFNTNGGTPVNPVTYDYQATTSAPVVPLKEGHTFAGWYSDAILTTSYVFNTMPAENLTLYAKWTINQYTISFNANGGSLVTALTQNFGSTINEPSAPTKVGHTFAGWYSDITLITAYTFTTMPAENITLYAKWTINPYTITFNSNGGSLVDPITQNYNTSIVAPTEPTKDEHTFAGWYSNIELTTAYTFTTMPAQNITLYAKWMINQSTVTFNSNGGSLVDSITQDYHTSLVAPSEPTKTGYTFDGWYSDIELTTPYIFTTMPTQNITLYAKWIPLIVYNHIGDMDYDEPTSVRVKGVIYYKFPNPMNPGFYLYDGTGYIFVLSSTEFNVGEGVEFEATYSIFEFTPQLTDVTLIQGNNTFLTMPTYVETSLESIAHADPNTPTLNGKTVIVDGYVEKMGMDYLLAPNFTDQKVYINYKSIQGLPDPFITKIGTRVQIHAIVLGYSPMQNAWHIIYQPAEPMVDITLTDQEKVDELLARGLEELDEKSFYSSQVLYIPTTDPYYSSTISWEPIGINASYVNMSTGEFETVDEPVDIIIRLTVTIGLATGYVDVTIHLLPIETITIEAFKLLPEMSYGFISAVVIFSSIDMGLMIVADETGILPVMSRDEVSYGDLVVVAGYSTSMEGLIFMTDEFGKGDTLQRIVAHDLSIPYLPEPMTILEFYALNPELPSSWMRYVEITGTIYYEEANHSFYVDDEHGAVMVLALTMSARDLLIAYNGFEVHITGIILPNFDLSIPQLMVIFTGEPEDIEMVLTEEELVVEMGLMLKEFIESKTYYPGQFLYLPTDHPVIPITVSYFSNVPALFNPSTNQISSDITEPIDFTIEATLTLGSYTEIVLITINVAPIEIMAIEDFVLTDGLISAYLLGVVIFKMEGFITTYMIADETGVVFLTSDWNFDIGTEVLLYGMLMQSDNMPYIVSMDDEVLEIKAFDQPNPLIPTELSLSDFLDLDVEVVANIFKYYTLEGTLSKLEFDFFYMLDDGINQVALYAPVPEAIAALNSYLGYYISISGLSMPMGDENQMMLVYLGSLEDVSLGGTDQEIFTELANSMIAYYASTTFVQGVYHQLPTSSISLITYDYTKGTHGAYYDLATGFISADITAETYIEINVTLTVQTYTNSFSIFIHVVPVDTLTISAFKLSAEDTLHMIRGVVVYSQFFYDGGLMIIADETDYMIVPVDLELVVGNEYIFEAMVDTVMGVKTMKEGTISVIEMIQTDVANPLIFTPIDILDILLLDPEDSSHWGSPIELSGYLMTDDYGNLYFIDAYGSLSMIIINIVNYDIYDIIYDYVMLEVKLKGYLLPNMSDTEIDGFSLFVDVEAEPEFIYTTDQEKIDALITLADYAIESPVSARSILELPDEFEILGATIMWSQIAGPMVFNPITKYIDNVFEPTMITIRATITIGSLTDTHDFLLEVTPFVVLNIPNYEDTMIESLFPGLMIHSIDYQSHYMGGTVFRVYLEFPLPESLGADYFILEYFSESEQIWKTFMYEDEPLTTWFYNTWEERWMNTTNFALNLPIDTEYRLRTYGTPEPMFSNAVYVTGSSFNTQFMGWNMDGSMYLTGVMMPEFGFGLEVSATVYDHDLEMYLEDVLIYEWYRVNPYTYEMTLIEGATSNLYITTFEDVGYIILSRIKGDGISAGGFVQMMSWETVKVMNPTRLVSYTTSGFVLEFSHLFDPTDLESLVLFNEYFDELTITDIIATPNPFVYEFVVDLSESSYVSLQLVTNSWMMVKLGSYMHYQMIEFDLT